MGQQLGRDRLIQILTSMSSVELSQAVTRTMSALDAWTGGANSRDDVSILVMEC